MPSFTKRNGAPRARSSARAGRRGGLRTWRQCNRGQQNECRAALPLRYAVRSMLGAGRRLRSAAGSSLTPVLLLVVTLGLPVGAHAGDRTNLPLKNWGGFSLYQDAVYDDLERLVTAGLADRTLLNTSRSAAWKRRGSSPAPSRASAGTTPAASTRDATWSRCSIA